MHPKKSENYEWALDTLRKEITRLEAGVKVLSCGSPIKQAVGMGFAGGSKGNGRGRIKHAICFKCGGEGHISRHCKTKPKNVSTDDKEKAAVALAKYNEAPARKAWLEEKKEEKRTSLGAFPSFTAQGVLEEEEYS